MLCIEEVARLERQVAESLPRKRASTSVDAIVAGAAAASGASGAIASGQATGGADGNATVGDAASATSAAASAPSGGASAPSTAEPSPAQYHLCAGCDIYVTLEPCAMCAMALVHSRVRRLVYALPALGAGALGSRYQLHAEKSLNHHFGVVAGMLRSEAHAAGLAAEAPGAAG